MNFKSQAIELHNFLLEYYPIWGQEIMDEYPKTIKDYPSPWIEELNQLNQEELFLIDSKQSFNKIKSKDFILFLERIQKITNISKIEETPELALEDWAYTGVKLKKRHEIQKIVPKIKNIFENNMITHINDIGGGVGHLSRILAHYHFIPTFSIDQNKTFQEIGEKRMKQFRKIPDAAKVTFINMKFGEDQHTQQVFTPESFSIGLHTCGNLAIKLLETNIEKKTMGLLSFGCCYHLIKRDSQFFLSDYYLKNNFLKLNLYGLSLATRSHAETNFANYLKKEKVKNYRYGFHLFMMKHFNRTDLLDIGECPLHTYDKPVSHYIMTKLATCNIIHSFDHNYIEQFFNSPEIQKELRTMFLCNIIRWQIGRVLEVFLLIDRCLFLEENGYDVKLEQYFKEALSPRNLGILGVLAPKK